LRPGGQSISKNPPLISPLENGGRGDSGEVNISVVIPLLNEERNVERLSHSLVDVLKRGEEKFEIIFVDDGSTDNTLQLLKTLHKKYNCIKIVKLTRNFGQQRAASAGIKYAKGKIIITMDGDLQYNPEDIPMFLKKIDEGFDAVIGYRKARKGGIFTRRIPSRIANIIISFLSGVYLRDLGCPFRAFRRELKDGIENYGEAGEGSSAFFMLWRASKVAEVEIDNSSRQSGKTSYNFSSLFMLLLDFIILFSIKPLQISILFLMGLSAIFFSTVLFLSSLFRFLPATTLYFALSILFFLTGVELITLGIINERLSRITSRVQQRPYYIVDEIIE
jgi:glycosyltransferase involved in cell wall biosynthesis